jgi:S-disulfanyl-L-cysteine oxidoreductase SoxD
VPERVTARPHVVAACAIAACALAACGDWPWRHDMVNQPSSAAGTDTRAAAGESIAAGSELPMSRELAELRLHNPVAPDAPSSTGRALYEIYCTPCHGSTGAGDGTVSRYFGSIPDLTAPDEQQHGDGWFYATITNGTERMPRYVSELTPAERWQIVGFLRAAGASR